MKKQEVEEEDSETLGAQVVVHAFKEKKNPGVHEERRSKFSNHNQFVVIVQRAISLHHHHWYIEQLFEKLNAPTLLELLLNLTGYGDYHLPWKIS